MKPKYILNIVDRKNIFFQTLPNFEELRDTLDKINCEYEVNEKDYSKLMSSGKINLDYYSEYDLPCTDEVILIDLECYKNNLLYLINICSSFHDEDVKKIFDIIYDKYTILLTTYDFIIFETDDGVFFVDHKILKKIDYTKLNTIKDCLKMIEKGKSNLDSILKNIKKIPNTIGY